MERMIGSTIITSIAIEKAISRKFSIGLDVLLPVWTHWNNDGVFIKYDYSNNTQQIAQNKFSIGSSVSYNYHF